MKFTSPKEIVDKLEKRGGGLKEICLLLFSFILLRNILEGILEKDHLFGLHPYPYRAILINFIHFPLFYLCVFLFFVLIFSIFSRDTKKDFFKIAGPISYMFWIILLPPIIDFFTSGGRGYDLSYILKGQHPLKLIYTSLNPLASLPGMTTGMKIEVLLAFVLFFIWLFVKRGNLFFAIMGTGCSYLAMLFLGLAPLLVANIFGANFSQFYGVGGILYYDTQKFAGIFFVLFLILSGMTIFRFFKDKFVEFYHPEPINILLTLTLMAGFLFGLKTFLSTVPDGFIPQDYLVLIILGLSGLLALQIAINRLEKFAIITGLIGGLIVSYYTFLGLLVCVILINLGKRYGRFFKVLFTIMAFFFAFLSGLAVFTHERAFSAISQSPGSGFYQIKNHWHEEEVLIREIEDHIKAEQWKDVDAIFATNPYAVSPPAIVYLKCLYHIKKGDYKEAQRYAKGAIMLGYKTKGPRLAFGDTYYYLHCYNQAIEIYNGMLRDGFDDIGVYKSLASAYFQKADFENSITCYKKAIELDDKDPHLFNNLGVIYLRRGEYHLARQSFTTALDLNPNHKSAQKNLSIIESRMTK